MKNLLSILLIISTTTFAQPYLGVGIQNKGMNMTAGVVAGGMEVNLKYQFPLTRADEKRILSATIGKMVLLSNYDEDNYSATLQVGPAWVKYNDYLKYDASEYGEVIAVSEVKPLVGLEIGKDSYMGRISLTASYCMQSYYGASMRIFFNR
jgi:hypothetical protein